MEAARLIKNLKNYTVETHLPLFNTWPVNRRSAVLVLLFIGSNGELRVFLTKRARNLRSFSGHVSLPGGKADSPSETSEMVARRESEEEIGLPSDGNILLQDYGMKIENITHNIPHFLSRTFLSVKPIVSFLYNSKTPSERRYVDPLNGSKFFGKLNAGETTSLFSVPLCDLIAHQNQWNDYNPEYVNRKEYISKWGGLSWLIQHFYYPNENVKDAHWLNEIIDTSSGDEDFEGVLCKNVWGLTAKILQEVCRVANDTARTTIGHEELIYTLHKFGGQLQSRKRTHWESDMILNKRKVYYSDVIPKQHFKKLSKLEF
ncbi:LADA_0G05644g1_1 [Lachancea dasiensis]|uniref:LADA_0G05644g1_1 n=1 Tax=Lachancea dasiensis TaxID=1072105 RepID=A0A1G4JSV7_9SACH|nr:LADA_0G05644g1_1 [Lachancea dasiensis]